MFGFFGNKGNSNNKRNNTPTKSTPPADYEPPVAASSLSSVNHQHQHQQQHEEELFGGMTVHSNSYGNTSTYSTSSGSSSRLSTHREVTPTISTHDTGSSFSFINDDDTTTSSATTPQDEIEHAQPVGGGLKINRAVGKGRRKNGKNSKVDEELKQLDQTSDELDRTYSMAQKTFSNIENNIKMNHPPTPQIQSINNNTNEEEEDDSTISSFLKNSEEEEEPKLKTSPVAEPRKSSSPSDDIDFASLQVKPRRVDRGNSSTEIGATSASTPVASTPVKVHESPVITAIKEEKPITTRRDSFKSESIEEEKEVVDNDWINIKSTINSSLTKYSTRISKLLDEEQKKIDEKRENQFSLIQDKIQSLEQLLDEYTEQEEFEKADQVEQELTELRSKIEEIQITEKNNDSYIPAISKTLTEMKKEINLVYSRVDFSFTTTKKDYDDFLKKNNPLKELRRERLESETNRIKRMGESIKLEENEFQKRKSRITDQIDSSTKDLRVQEDCLRDQNDEISREIAELERKLKEKRIEQKNVISQLNDITDKINKYEEDFNEQLKLISYDEEQFQKRKQNYLDDVDSFEKLSSTLNKDLTNIEAKETKKYDAMMDKRQYKDYLQTQQVRVSQIIDMVERLDKLEESPGSSSDSRSHIIKEVGALTQQLSTLKSHLSSVSMELDNSTQQLQRANDRLPKVQADKLEYAKARKFKEAAQCKEESDKLTKLIQELEASIPSLKQEQTQLEEQKTSLAHELDAAHNKLEQVDKVDSKRFISLCLKRIDFLEQNRVKLIEVETPEQLKLRFDVIDELIALFNYQVRQLKAIISLSDEELIQMKKSINTPPEQPKTKSPKSPVVEEPKQQEIKNPVKEVKVVEENLSPKDKLVKLEYNLEELKKAEIKINDDINDALEKEQFDLCEVLDGQLEETKAKISELKGKIEELRSQIPVEEEPKVVEAVVEEEPTQDQVVEEEPVVVQTAAVVSEEAPQEEEHVEEYQTFNDNEVADEKPQAFDFIQAAEEPTEEVETTEQEKTETTSSFNFIAEESQNEEPKQEEVVAEEETTSSFDFIASEDEPTEEIPVVEPKPETEPVVEEEKSSFDFIATGTEEEKTENQEESSFEFLNE